MDTQKDKNYESYESIRLERIKASALEHFPDSEFLNTLKIDVSYHTMHGAIAKLVAHVWTEKLQNEKEIIAIPLTWWDHLKTDKPWLKKIFKGPIKTKAIKVMFERTAVYPRFVNHEASKHAVIIHEDIFEEVDFNEKCLGLVAEW